MFSLTLQKIRGWVRICIHFQTLDPDADPPEMDADLKHCLYV